MTRASTLDTFQFPTTDTTQWSGIIFGNDVLGLTTAIGDDADVRGAIAMSLVVALVDAVNDGSTGQLNDVASDVISIVTSTPEIVQTSSGLARPRPITASLAKGTSGAYNAFRFNVILKRVAAFWLGLVPSFQAITSQYLPPVHPKLSDTFPELQALLDPIVQDILDGRLIDGKWWTPQPILPWLIKIIGVTPPPLIPTKSKPIPVVSHDDSGTGDPPQVNLVSTKLRTKIPRVIGFQGPPGQTGGKKGLPGGDGGGPSGNGVGPDPDVDGSGDTVDSTEQQQDKGQTFNAGTGVAPVDPPQNKDNGQDNDGTPEVTDTQTDQDGQPGVEDSKTETTTTQVGDVVTVTTTTTISFRPDPEGDGSGGAESKPAIPYGPRHNAPTPSIPSNPWSPLAANVRRRLLEQALLGLRTYGYASGDDIGSAGVNPRFAPAEDPDDVGATEGGENEEGESPSEYDPSDQHTNPQNHDNLLTGGGGFGTPDPDNEWGAGGYNPHYQPLGATTWTSSLRGGTGLTRVAPAPVVVLARRMR